MLPDIVVTMSSGARVPLRPDRGETTVLVWSKDPSGYASALAAINDEFRVWEARLLTLTAESDHVIVADRYGQVFYSERSLVAPRQLAEWLKHLATLCPE